MTNQGANVLRISINQLNLSFCHQCLLLVPALGASKILRDLAAIAVAVTRSAFLPFS